MNIKLLDCTLRDGGYINDWNFGLHTSRDIVRKLVNSGVNYVEVGFLRDCEYDKERCLYNNCSQIEPVLPEPDKRGDTLFTAMALHNKYDINKLEPYDGKTISAIRVTFHNYDIDEGLQFVSKAKEKGYKVFCNPINIMGYSDDGLLQLIDKINKIQPYAFSIVDTFGSMMREDLRRIYSLVEHNLDKSVVIGLHLHENLGLSYSLAQDFISMKAEERKSVIDGSMLGMGRVPGNLCMELIMDYLNRTQGAAYDVNPVLDGIDDHIAALKQKQPWGYNVAYALSAKFNLHRNYAEFLLGKGRLRAKQINKILANIDESKKAAFDEAYAQSLYEEFQDYEIDDSDLRKKLEIVFKDRKILILAPGSSIASEKTEIDRYIQENKPLIISANFIPDIYEQDYVFCSNAVRYSALEDKCDSAHLLVTSNLMDVCNINNILNFSDLCFDDKGKCDNCVIMLVKLMIRFGKREVAIAGFDGYRKDGCNYIAEYMTSQHTKGQEENVRNTQYVTDLKKRITIRFLTDSIYDR